MKSILITACLLAILCNVSNAQKPKVSVKSKSTPIPTYNILDAWKDSLVQVSGVGNSITEINATVKNKTNRSLRIVVTPGTYFVASGDYQNMVVRQRISLILKPKESKYFEVLASCINANRPIPYSSDNFAGIDTVSTDLQRFLLKAANEHEMVVQAGVWAITDAYSAMDVREHLRWSDGSEAVSSAHIIRARAILKALNIPNRL